MQKKQKVIVTGASGFLGFSLVKYLIERNMFVYCVCRPGSSKLPRLQTYLKGLPSPPEENACIIELDLHDMARLPERISCSCDLFYHLGWDGGVKIATGQDLNILTSAMALLSAVKTGCKRFISSGSQAEYGLHESRIFEYSTLHPVTAYGEAKVAAYFLTKTLAEKHGIQHIWCRIFSVYGPDENPDTLISNCILSLLDGKSPQVTPCEQIWNYLYQEDAAEALYLLGTSSCAHGVYNLGAPDCRPLKGYLEVLHQTVKRIKSDIPDIAFGSRSYALDQVMHLEPDLAKLNRDTGCLLRTSFEDGIQRTVQKYAADEESHD